MNDIERKELQKTITMGVCWGIWAFIATALGMAAGLVAVWIVLGLM